MCHLGFQRPLLNLGDAFLDDEGDAIGTALRRLCEVLPEKLQLPLELLVPALDGQGFQALLVAGQVALENKGKRHGGGNSSMGQAGGQPPGIAHTEELLEHDGREENAFMETLQDPPEGGASS